MRRNRVFCATHVLHLGQFAAFCSREQPTENGVVKTRHMSTLPSIVVTSLMFVGCSSQAETSTPTGGSASRPASGPSSRPSGSPSADLHAPFQALLSKHVRNERVDYLTWRDEDGAALDSYLDVLAAIDVASLAEPNRLAFYINLYNATMIDTILDRVDADYSTAEDGHGVFNESLVRLSTGTISLNHLENEIVRKQFDEPRIHVALVCGARSCPPLLPRAYNATDLEDVLEANMKRFLTGSERNKIGARLELSSLFDWYAADFGGKDGVPKYLARYAGDEVLGRPVSFLEYSWELNIAKPTNGEWVKLTKAAGDLAEGAIVRVASRDGDNLRVRRPFGRGDATVPAGATAAY